MDTNISTPVRKASIPNKDSRTAINTTRHLFTCQKPELKNKLVRTDPVKYSDHFVRHLFNSVILSKQRTISRDTSGDTEAVSKAAKVILGAVQDGTLTDKEANAVLELMARNYVAHRFDRVFENISNMGESQWFLAASREARG